MTMTQVTICGGGNLGHALAGWLAARIKGIRVHVLLSGQERVSHWETGIARQNGILVIAPEETRCGRPELVTADPAKAVRGSRVIIFALPAFLHQVTLAKVAPFVDAGALVGAIPAHGGFQWGAERAFKGMATKPVIFGFRKSPWTCRVVTYGHSVRITGVRASMEVSAEPTTAVHQMAEELSHLFGIAVAPLPHFLHVTLSIGNQILHPGILYGLLRDWDGTPFAEPPLAYQGISEVAARILLNLSDESQAIGDAVGRELPCLQLPPIRSLAEEMRTSAKAMIEDSSTLRTIIGTNRGLFGLRIPSTQVQGGWIPDSTSRYLSEDVPFGLCVLRGIAEITGVTTPTIDEVLNWAQMQLGASYLRDGTMSGPDLARSGAPQAYGLRTLTQLMRR
jgi:hypothetical protein